MADAGGVLSATTESPRAETAGAEAAGAELAGTAAAGDESIEATGLAAARVTGAAAWRLMKKAGAMAMAIISRIAQRVRRSMVSLDHDIRGRDRRHPDETDDIAGAGAPRARSREGLRSA